MVDGFLVWALPYVAAAFVIALSVVASLHAVLYKREPRAAIAWAGLIWLSPVVGALLYALFGINRTRRRAAVLRKHRIPIPPAASTLRCPPEGLPHEIPPELGHLQALARIGETVTEKPLLKGNLVAALENGEEAYPAMIEAIDGARRSVALETYIFARDRVGQRFVDALVRVRKRGVEVRVLVDDVGGSWSIGATLRALRREGIAAARFHPLWLPFWTPYLNLRNHRKILVADGRVAFTGGMNLWRVHLLKEEDPRRAFQDLHFRLEGPVVAQAQEVFADDWAFSTEEVLEGEAWFPPLEPRGPAVARGVPFDPGQHLDSLRWMIMGAIASARSSVRVVTPYFLPDQGLVAALNVAALRGLRVEVVLPETSDVALVKWASRAMLWQILGSGCKVWLTPPPFDHSKVIVVDEAWSFFGSANLDPRSLRLNFEFNVECYDAALARALGGVIDRKLKGARAVTLADVDGRPLPVKIRDGIARLFSPYL